MKKMFLRGAIAVLGLGMVATLGSCSSSESSTDVLYVGMECNYQPFNWTTPTETEHTLPIYHNSNFADGYDVAVSKYLGQKLNKEVIVKKIEWSSLIPSLNSDEIDIVLAGMTDTAERRQSIDFSNPYLASDLAFLVRTKDVPSDLGTKENPASLFSLFGLTTSVKSPFTIVPALIVSFLDICTFIFCLFSFLSLHTFSFSLPLPLSLSLLMVWSYLFLSL